MTQHRPHGAEGNMRGKEGVYRGAKKGHSALIKEEMGTKIK